MRILLADDHPIVRRGLRGLLDEAGFPVTAEAEDGLSAVRLCEEIQPEVMILDIAMPKLNGIEVALRASKLDRPPAVIFLTMYSDESYIMRALEAGARAYLLKSAADEDLVPAMRAVAAGKPFFSPAVAGVLIEDYVRRLQTHGLTDSYHLLTSREKEVMQLLAEGRSNKEVASELEVGLSTVETHRANFMQKLKGKIALITGASRGIGRGIAEIFAEEGADVAVNYAASAAKAEEVAAWVRGKGRRAITVKADVARRAEVEAMFDRVWKELGPIDILVNNAGIETITPFLELTDEQWTRLTDTNLRGCWLNSQVFCRRAIAEGRKGNIIHIGSVQSAKSLPGRTHYAPTKLGLNALTRNMSTEVAPQGIRVNCVHPGLIETDMTDWVMKDPEILPQVLAQISLGRAGQPREVGTVVAFFASDEAQYVTGQSLLVEGGFAGK